MIGKFLATGALALILASSAGLYGCSKKDEGQSPSGAQSPGMQAGQASHSALINELKARLAERPDDPDVIVKLADAYFELKQFNDAVVYYKKYLEFQPGNADTYNEIGLCLHYTGNTAEGLKYVEEGIKREPLNQRIWLTKGFLLAYGMGDLDGARAAWEKARVLNPESQIGQAAAEFLAQFTKKQG